MNRPQEGIVPDTSGNDCSGIDLSSLVQPREEMRDYLSNYDYYVSLNGEIHQEAKANYELYPQNILTLEARFNKMITEQPYWVESDGNLSILEFDSKLKINVGYRDLSKDL
jgi:hypothetical protein